MLNVLRHWQRSTLMAFGLILVAGIGHTAPATPPQCFAVDNGSGTVTLPPAGCEYLSPAQVHKIINGLPAGTEIILAPIHRNFICRQSSGGSGCGGPGGTLGGEAEAFTSTAVFQVTGTGVLSGWNRVISVPLNVETHIGKRTPGDPIQSFPTDMFRIQGQITGDPDFSLLRFTGGTANGYSSPGYTTLTRQSNGSFAVDSYFDVTFALDFTGAGKLEGYSGRTIQKVRMKAYASNQQ